MYTVPAPGDLRYVFAAVERRALLAAVTNQSVAVKTAALAVANQRAIVCADRL